MQKKKFLVTFGTTLVITVKKNLLDCSGPAFAFQTLDKFRNRLSPYSNTELLIEVYKYFYYYYYYYYYYCISFLSSTYKILNSILLLTLTPYTEEIIWNCQCGFRRNRSNADRVFCIRQILEKREEHKEAVHQLFIDFTKVYDSVRIEVMNNIVIEFGIPMEMLIKICLNETCSRVRVGKSLSDRFRIKIDVKQGNVLSPLLCNFISEYAIRRFQVNQRGLKLNSTHQILAYADDVNILGGRAHTIKEKKTL